MVLVERWRVRVPMEVGGRKGGRVVGHPPTEPSAISLICRKCGHAVICCEIYLVGRDRREKEEGEGERARERKTEGRREREKNLRRGRERERDKEVDGSKKEKQTDEKDKKSVKIIIR